MMTSRERVLRTLEFNAPDRVPVDLWSLPRARLVHGEAFDRLYRAHDPDIVSVWGPFDRWFAPEYYQQGRYTDPWGSVWAKQEGGPPIAVWEPVFADYKRLEGYEPPVAWFLSEWDAAQGEIAGRIAQARHSGKFIIGGWINLFERMRLLRGPEELFCDIAREEDGLFRVMEIVMRYMRSYLERWLEMDIDAVFFDDNWGARSSLLIPVRIWRRMFRPLYRELIGRTRAAGKKVFFHSGGYIWDLYPELIESGADAVNSDLWRMGTEKVAAHFAGKITFWGKINCRWTLPFGTPEEIYAEAHSVKRHLFCGGGLIGQSEIGGNIPLANTEAALTAWNR